MSDGDMPFTAEAWQQWAAATQQEQAMAAVSLGLQPHDNTRRNNRAIMRRPLLRGVAHKSLRVMGALNFRISTKTLNMYKPQGNEQ